MKIDSLRRPPSRSCSSITGVLLGSSTRTPSSSSSTTSGVYPSPVGGPGHAPGLTVPARPAPGQEGPRAPVPMRASSAADSTARAFDAGLRCFSSGVSSDEAGLTLGGHLVIAQVPGLDPELRVPGSRHGHAQGQAVVGGSRVARRLDQPELLEAVEQLLGEAGCVSGSALVMRSSDSSSVASTGSAGAASSSRARPAGRDAAGGRCGGPRVFLEGGHDVGRGAVAPGPRALGGLTGGLAGGFTGGGVRRLPVGSRLVRRRLAHCCSLRGPPQRPVGRVATHSHVGCVGGRGDPAGLGRFGRHRLVGHGRPQRRLGAVTGASGRSPPRSRAFLITLRGRKS